MASSINSKFATTFPYVIGTSEEKNKSTYPGVLEYIAFQPTGDDNEQLAAIAERISHGDVSFLSKIGSMTAIELQERRQVASNLKRYLTEKIRHSRREQSHSAKRLEQLVEYVNKCKTILYKDVNHNISTEQKDIVTTSFQADLRRQQKLSDMQVEAMSRVQVARDKSNFWLEEARGQKHADEIVGPAFEEVDGTIDRLHHRRAKVTVIPPTCNQKAEIRQRPLCYAVEQMMVTPLEEIGGTIEPLPRRRAKVTVTPAVRLHKRRSRLRCFAPSYERWRFRSRRRTAKFRRRRREKRPHTT